MPLQDENLILLNKIEENAATGVSSLHQVRKKLNDPALKSLLKLQQNSYQNLSHEARDMILKRGDFPNIESMARAIPRKAGIAIETALDRSPAHIAQMLIQGNSLGIDEVTRMLQLYPNLSPQIRTLGEELISLEQRNVEELKPYL